MGGYLRGDSRISKKGKYDGRNKLWKGMRQSPEVFCRSGGSEGKKIKSGLNKGERRRRKVVGKGGDVSADLWA